MPNQKTFVDSSVFIAALLSNRGGSFFILNNLRNYYHSVTNEYVMDEVLEAVDVKFSGRRELKSSLYLLVGLSDIEIVSNPSKSILKKISNMINKEDAPILASAILEGCGYLLTLDNDFFENKLIDFANLSDLKIMKPKNFIELHRSTHRTF